MSAELTYLTYTILLTGILWVPYILNQIAVRGLLPAMGYQDNPAPLAGWAQRLKSAHYNAVENLVLFAPLVLIIELRGIGSSTTAIACLVFFLARIVHALCYTFKVPYLRTLAFAVGFFAVLALLVHVLSV
ncbi:MAG: MAPEG family protein [Pseudohongiellaceae bacterium]